MEFAFGVDNLRPLGVGPWLALQAELQAEQKAAGWLRNRATTLRVVLSVGVPTVLVAWHVVANRREDWG